MGATLTTGYHIRSSQSLKFIAANPNDVTLASPAVWDVALPASARNFFPFEPYPADANTMIEEQDAFMDFVASVESGPSLNPRYFVYATWPGFIASGGDYVDYFNQAVADGDSTPVSQKKAFYGHYYERIKALRPNTFLIPTAMVMEQFQIEASQGLVPDGIDSVFDLYRDDLHLNSAGHYLAAYTKMAVALQRRDIGANARAPYRLVDPVGPYLSDALADYIEALVWRVVTADGRTGV